jgi:hypothetical protein
MVDVNETSLCQSLREDGVALRAARAPGAAGLPGRLWEPFAEMGEGA